MASPAHEPHAAAQARVRRVANRMAARWPYGATDATKRQCAQAVRSWLGPLFGPLGRQGGTKAREVRRCLLPSASLTGWRVATRAFDITR
jgi:hypothetical protein